jgi:hypothetical protein
MKKIAIAFFAMIALTTAANADYYRHGGYHGGRGGGWVAPLVGGLIVGGIVGGALAEPRYYAPPPVYVTPPTHTECQFVPVYDRWGNYRGDRRECYQVPNY